MCNNDDDDDDDDDDDVDDDESPVFKKNPLNIRLPTCDI